MLIMAKATRIVLIGGFSGLGSTIIDIVPTGETDKIKSEVIEENDCDLTTVSLVGSINKKGLREPG